MESPVRRERRAAQNLAIAIAIRTAHLDEYGTAGVRRSHGDEAWTGAARTQAGGRWLFGTCHHDAQELEVACRVVVMEGVAIGTKSNQDSSVIAGCTGGAAEEWPVEITFRDIHQGGTRKRRGVGHALD